MAVTSALSARMPVGHYLGLTDLSRRIETHPMAARKLLGCLCTVTRARYATEGVLRVREQLDSELESCADARHPCQNRDTHRASESRRMGLGLMDRSHWDPSDDGSKKPWGLLCQCFCALKIRRAYNVTCMSEGDAIIRSLSEKRCLNKCQC